MARGRKSYTPVEELEVVSYKIESTEQELKNLKSRKKEIEKLVRDEEISNLYDAVKQSGKSISEIVEMIIPH